jgi:ribosomal RNA-processing protein 36
LYSVLDSSVKDYVAEQKKIVAQARYSDLAQKGGRHAVQRALAKKQKKLSQKEKKSRPFKAAT